MTQHGYCQDNHVYRKGDCELISGKTANCGDSNNKNGYWIHYETGMTSHTDFVDDPSQYSEEKTYMYLISEGQYLNNLKIGKWIYYSEYRSYEKQYVERISFYDKYSKKDSLEFEYFNDSIHKSKTYWNHGIKDSLIVYYENKQTKFEAKYKDNMMYEFRIYYPNGGLKYCGCNVLDNKIENLKRYDTDGQESEVREYDISMIAILEDLIEYIN